MTYRKQTGVTNYRQYQAPSNNRISNIRPDNKSLYSYNQSSFGYPPNYQKKSNEDRAPLNLTNYRANINPNNTSNEKINSIVSPILSYQFEHRINYSKDFEKKESPSPNYYSATYGSSNSKTPISTPASQQPLPSSSYQVPKNNDNSKDSESYFRPTSYHQKYSSLMTNFQYKDDYKPTEYVTKSSAASSKLLKSIQEQTQNQIQNQNQNQTFDPTQKDQEAPPFDYNASLFFAKQALLNGSNYKQYRPNDNDQNDSIQTDINQNYDLSKNPQSNYNSSQFSLNNNDNGNSVTTFYSKSNGNNNDSSYKSNFNFNSNNDLYNKTNYNNNNYDYLKPNQNQLPNGNENDFDDDFLTKLKNSISTSVSGENSSSKSNLNSFKYANNDHDSFTNYHIDKNENNATSNISFDEETITIDIPKKRERVESKAVQEENDKGLDLQAKLAKFRQTISLVRKTEEDYGDLFPQDKSKTDDNDNKEGEEETMLKDVTNDMLSEPSLIFADSQNQS